MKIAFRADASIQMGTGHVMRCLTLAEELKAQGHEACFICRDHEGHLADLIQAKGFALHLLVSKEVFKQSHALDWNSHASWLGAGWQEDAKQTSEFLEAFRPAWLVVDHYALDMQWEKLIRPYVRHIMVIDDMADRPHECELLLDQTFGRSANDYLPWVNQDCQCLCGAEYALLRPEFARLREYSLKRRHNPQLRQLLVTMGGVDKDNVTGQVLKALHGSDLPQDCKIVVVMGATAPWLADVETMAASLPWQTEVKVGVTNMAELMAESDLAIGAAGATSWERCCLGLPSLMLVLADNQKLIAYKLSNVGAATTESVSHMDNAIVTFLSSATTVNLDKMGHNASKITDGNGVKKVIHKLKAFS